MFRNLMNWKSILLAIALGLSALGSATMPAAAWPGHTFGGMSPAVIPHIGGGAVSKTITGVNPVIPVPKPQTPSPIVSKNVGDLGNRIVNLPDPPKSNSGPLVSKNVGDLGNRIVQIPQPPTPPTPPKPPLPNCKGPNGECCPPNAMCCPPGGCGGGGGGGGKPGKDDDDKDHHPVVVIPIPAPPVMVQNPVYAQPPVYARQQPVAVTQQPVVQQPVAQTAVAAPNAAAAEPCNCLTKQYLDDGSVVFRDLCTHEAAMATQAELRAEAEAAAR
jgi:hypothetical protein